MEARGKALLSLTIITVLGFGTINAAFARVMRAEGLRVRNSAYVEAASGCGVDWLGNLWRHVLSNAAGPVLALAGREVARRS